MDQGSIGWPSNYFLYFHKKLRGWMFMDPSHRTYNNALDALKDSCLAHLKQEMTICVNLGSAPWGSCGHFFSILPTSRRQMPFLLRCTH
eukprot:893468-Heterocapsa_arctica.AAC.1